MFDPQAKRNDQGIYSPLDKSKREIRVLRILPSEGQIRCSLEVVSLDDHVEFDTLSYVWGDPEECQKIQVNGREIDVRDNLYEALQTFRQDGSIEGCLWIDALCINQQDLSERASQVSMMGSIYSSARTVLIWLGQEGVYTQAALRRLGVIDLNEKGKIRNEGESLSEHEIQGLTHLMSSPWWNRIWVLQEAGLARNPIARIGKLSTGFGELVEGLWNLHMSIVHKVYGGRQIPTPAERHLADETLNADIFRRKSHRSNNPRDVYYILLYIQLCNKRDATDPRDRVFGLLGILPPALNIQPRYDTSVEKVYEDATSKIIDWSRSLKILDFAGHRPETSFPSWVPDFRELHVQTFLSNFSACADVPACTNSERPGSLNVEGLFVDQIENVGSAFTPGRTSSHVDLLFEFKKWRSLAETAERAYTSRGQSVGDAYWRTLTMDRCDNFTNDHYRSLDAEFLGPYKTEVDPSFWKFLFQKIIGTIGHKRFFVTKNGRLGVSRGEVRKGDQIAILAGSPFPFVLRQSVDKEHTKDGPKRFQLVAPCYCDGIMYGEAVPSEAVHNAFCDGCGNAICGLRYKCKEGCDFDVCQKCITTANSTHEHRFQLINDPTPGKDVLIDDGDEEENEDKEKIKYENLQSAKEKVEDGVDGVDARPTSERPWAGDGLERIILV